MVLARWYLPILHAHVACVVLSGSLFALRGGMMLAGSPRANHPLLRRLSWLIDSILLAAAIALTLILHQYPLVNAWLTVKVLLLATYIVLGIFALRRGRTWRMRRACLLAALAVFLFIISVAVTHDPRGVFVYLG